MPRHSRQPRHKSEPLTALRLKCLPVGTSSLTCGFRPSDTLSSHGGSGEGTHGGVVNMHSSFGRAVVAAVIGMGVLAGLLRADEQTTASPVTGPMMVQETVPATQQAVATASLGADPGQWQVRKHNWWHCWSHHNTLGCGSFKSDFMFIFGSCRTYYGEPCLKGPPPPPPWMQGLDAAPGSCRCR